MKKKLLSAFLVASVIVPQSVPIMAETITPVSQEISVMPRWVGSITTGWITAGDGKSRAQFTVIYNDVGPELGSVTAVNAISSIGGGAINNVKIQSQSKLTSRMVYVTLSFRDSVYGNKTGSYLITI